MICMLNGLPQEQFVDRVYDLEKVNTDWYDELFRTDVSHKHSLSISGGSEFVNYYFLQDMQIQMPW